MLAGFLALCLFAACEEPLPDYEAPAVRLVYPADGDTLGTGPNALRAIATDNIGVRFQSFWIRGEFIGIARFARGDTYEIWWECSSDTLPTYTLSAVTEDAARNSADDNITVHIRR